MNNINVYASKICRSGLIFEGAHIRGAYIRDVKWVTYLVGAYSGGVLTAVYGMPFPPRMKLFMKMFSAV